MTTKQTKQVHELWDRMADFPVSETGAALNHFMETLSLWLQLDDAVWVGAVRMAHGAAARRDPQLGWRGRAVHHLKPTPQILHLSKIAVKGQETDPGMTTRALTAMNGTFRVHRLRDGFVDFKAFRRTDHYHRIYTEAGIVDRIFIGFPVDEDTESFFLLDRFKPGRRFTRHDAELGGYATRGLKWFHRQLLLHHGVRLACSPLTPMQREVMGLLLTGKTEKDIAHALVQSANTTHRHIKEIFRKLGVKSRAGVMALWLGRR